mmetsp:Transcript_6244/g.15712  ORF Transcript_6244/g.15712 Transcript_6244/m.15712 type:complete len:1174 (-) Transcript_6244:964-4485(-)
MSRYATDETSNSRSRSRSSDSGSGTSVEREFYDDIEEEEEEEAVDSDDDERGFDGDEDVAKVTLELAAVPADFEKGLKLPAMRRLIPEHSESNGRSHNSSKSKSSSKSSSSSSSMVVIQVLIPQLCLGVEHASGITDLWQEALDEEADNTTHEDGILVDGINIHDIECTIEGASGLLMFLAMVASDVRHLRLSNVATGGPPTQKQNQQQQHKHRSLNSSSHHSSISQDNDTVLNTIALAFADTPLLSLDLSRNHITRDLLDVFGQQEDLELLSLNDCKLVGGAERGYNAFSRAIKEMRRMKQLELSNTGLEPRALKHLTSTLKRSELSLQALNLSRNPLLGDDGCILLAACAKEIAQSQQKPKRVPTRINVERCNVGNVGALALLSVLGKIFHGQKEEKRDFRILIDESKGGNAKLDMVKVALELASKAPSRSQQVSTTTATSTREQGVQAGNPARERDRENELKSLRRREALLQGRLSAMEEELRQLNDEKATLLGAFSVLGASQQVEERSSMIRRIEELEMTVLGQVPPATGTYGRGSSQQQKESGSLAISGSSVSSRSQSLVEVGRKGSSHRHPLGTNKDRMRANVLSEIASFQRQKERQVEAGVRNFVRSPVLRASSSDHILRNEDTTMRRGPDRSLHRQLSMSSVNSQARDRVIQRNHSNASESGIERGLVRQDSNRSVASMKSAASTRSISTMKSMSTMRSARSQRSRGIQRHHSDSHQSFSSHTSGGSIGKTAAAAPFRRTMMTKLKKDTRLSASVSNLDLHRPGLERSDSISSIQSELRSRKPSLLQESSGPEVSIRGRRLPVQNANREIRRSVSRSSSGDGSLPRPVLGENTSLQREISERRRRSLLQATKSLPISKPQRIVSDQHSVRRSEAKNGSILKVSSNHSTSSEMNVKGSTGSMHSKPHDRMSASLSASSYQDDFSSKTRKSSSSHSRSLRNASNHSRSNTGDDESIDDPFGDEINHGNSTSSSMHLDDVFFKHKLADVAEERPSTAEPSSPATPKSTLSDRKVRSEHTKHETDRGLPVLLEYDSSGSSFVNPDFRSLLNKSKSVSANITTQESERDSVGIKDADEEAFEKLRSKFLKKKPSSERSLRDSSSPTTQKDDFPPKSPRRTTDDYEKVVTNPPQASIPNLKDPSTPHTVPTTDSKSSLTPSSLDSGKIYVA